MTNIADCYVCPKCYVGLAVIQRPQNDGDCKPQCCGVAMDKMWAGHENAAGSPSELVARLRS